MVFSQGSSRMARGQTIRDQIDAKTKRRENELNKLRKKLEQTEEKKKTSTTSPSQTAIEQIVAYARLGEEGNMQGSLSKGRNTGKHPFRLLESRILPMPPISAVSKKTPRRIRPSNHVFDPIELPPGARFSSGPVDEPLNPIKIGSDH